MQQAAALAQVDRDADRKREHEAAGVAATVYAQTPFQGPGVRGGMGAMHGGPMYGDPSARADAHPADLKQQLGITGAQESEWQAFADAVKQQAQGMVAMRASMETLTGAAKPLYAVLTTGQKSTFDRAGLGAGFGPGHLGPRAFRSAARVTAVA